MITVVQLKIEMEMGSEMGSGAIFILNAYLGIDARSPRGFGVGKV